MDLLHPNIAVPGFHKTAIDTMLIDLSINIVHYQSEAIRGADSFQLSVKKMG